MRSNLSAFYACLSNLHKSRSKLALKTKKKPQREARCGF